MPLLILFIIVPVLEIFLFIEIGDKIGTGWTIFSVLATAFIGTALVRKQGLDAWTKAQSGVQQNQLPMEQIFTGLCLLVAGALLLTPGFLTDAIGFTLLVPPFRRVLGASIWGWVSKNSSFRMHQGGFNPHGPAGGFSSYAGQDDIIDGDFSDVTPGSSNSSSKEDISSSSPQISQDQQKNNP